LWVRLLSTLALLRWGLPVRTVGELFGVHDRTVRRWRDQIEELLVEYGFFPPGASGPIRTLEDLADHLVGLDDAMVRIDGTEIRRWSPGEWEAQQAAWSGKTKDHVVKATVVADGSGRPVWVEANPSGEGRTSDLKMLRTQEDLLGVLTRVAGEGVRVLADRGYPTLDRDVGSEGVAIPTSRNRWRELTSEEKARNRELSRLRLPVEHAIGKMKWWRTLTYWRRPIDAFDTTIKAIGVLATLT